MKLFNLTWNSIIHAYVGTLTVKQAIKHNAAQDCTYLTLAEDICSADDVQSASPAFGKSALLNI